MTGTSDWSRILTAAGRTAGDDGKTPEEPPAEAALFAPLLRAPPGRGFVIGQVGQSLDGRVATRTGHSRTINGPDGIRHLHRLRALVDAVVVGVGTATVDDPQLTVRLCPGPSPVPVVIDPTGRLPRSVGLCAAQRGAVLVTGPEVDAPPGLRVLRLQPRGTRFACGDIVDGLARLGLHRLLIEGGPRTVSAFLAEGQLDRLHVSVAPFLLGSGPTGISLPPIDKVDEAVRPPVCIHHLGSDLLFDLALRG